MRLIFISLLFFIFIVISPACSSDGEKFLKKGYDLWLSGNFNKYPEALNMFRKAVLEDPDNSEYHSAVGRILFELGDYNESLKELQKSLKVESQKAWINAWSHICLGEIYEKLGDYTSALKEYDKALKLNSTENSVREAMARKTLVQWKRKESLHFIFYYPEGGIVDREIDNISLEYQKKYTSISSYLGVSLKDKIQCYLFPSVEKCMEIMGEKTGFSRPQVKQIYTLYGTEEHDPPGRQMALILSFYIGKTRNREPLLSWGLSEFMCFPEKDFQGKILELKRTESFIPLSRLKGDFYRYPVEVSYNESACFVQFLIDRYGLEKFKKLWIQDDIDNSFKKIYGKTFSELDEVWNKYLANKDKVIVEEKTQDE
ncbi:MAG TPA: tetratricopeptide repeat protein [Candidatus Eremiobacteraeota bacterium]|nr:MAG: Tetratricopeptide repeat protein [bacterium ADurb.Bin363]HPZ06989.1 tetratricopeptide repeat protein [Candidatus Eremiobacteraeota bacterium]